MVRRVTGTVFADTNMTINVQGTEIVDSTAVADHRAPRPIQLAVLRTASCSRRRHSLAVLWTASGSRRSTPGGGRAHPAATEVVITSKHRVPAPAPVALRQRLGARVLRLRSTIPTINIATPRTISGISTRPVKGSELELVGAANCWAACTG